MVITMKRLEKTALLLSLMKSLKCRGSWCGETHTQKATFFLQELLHVPLGYNFILYKHGPYSFDLNEELTAMRADGMIHLVPQPYPYGPTLNANDMPIMHQYDYITDKYKGQIEFVADK